MRCVGARPHLDVPSVGGCKAQHVAICQQPKRRLYSLRQSLGKVFKNLCDGFIELLEIAARNCVVVVAVSIELAGRD